MGTTTLQIKQIRCEYRDNPIGIGCRKPRFSWQLASDAPGTLQTAYRIQAAESPEGLAAGTYTWDTGEVQSDQSVLVEYEGNELKADRRYWYQVRVWDNYGGDSGWSDARFWEMGLLAPDDWEAAWITPDPSAIDAAAEEAFLLRREFAVGAAPKRAMLYATSLGFYELELNGRRVGDWQYTPGWTSYRHRLQVQAYDVTAQLAGGSPNVIGATLSNGWYSGDLGWGGARNHYGAVRALLLQLRIEYADGSVETVVSDANWRASTGQVRMAEIYHGETYDARLEQEGWSRPGFEDGAWSPVATIDYPKTILVMQENEPSRVTEKLKPLALLTTPAGETVLDMGQNMVGRLHMKLNLPAGTELTLTHAEVLDREGNFYVANLRKAKQQVRYVCKGGEEEYESQFSFYGFRYVKIEGWPTDVPLNEERFAGHVIHTDMEPAGSFECSHPLLNKLQSNIVWGQRGNFLDVPTDCPQRDERLGWTGDAQVFVRTAAFNYGVAPFFAKWLRDLKADQRADGGVPFVVPHILSDTSFSSAAWGDAAVICPWTIYQCYGDKRVLEEQYESMRGWVDYIRAQGDDELLWNTGFHFGDWLGLDAKEGSYVGATPTDLIATCFYAYSTGLFVKAAQVLGQEEDVRTYGALYERIAEAFLREFITPSGRLAAHTQTGHVLPLMFELVDGPVRERLARTLAKYVEDQKHHLTTGFVGTPYLCHVLTDNGYHELAVKLVQQEEYPSWLYSVNQGATTIWEHWDGLKPDGSFWSEDMNSFNHYAYGAIGDWLYRAVAGLDMEETEPGYKRILFRPRPDSGLEYAKAAYESAYGTIRSEWRIVPDGTVRYEFEIPANATAVVLLRGATAQSAEVNGLQLSQADTRIPGVQVAEEENGTLRLELGSGRYQVKAGLGSSAAQTVVSTS
ncbi:glycoside hydrolase family 78 protein [Paenibacillus methanolicus]|uniref:alpha-L-rhamnosidase n=1 Tax=Paenibacillus methanolicus TaxID=582686 RepID=A0A5S5CLP0_9BACL|nr:glycoside hydrolase family 78 protein [Paenibacillus methanolicus]TYP79873.1 alpha-L-rhamnosidase [Paenibacillus methanolicus]